MVPDKHQELVNAVRLGMHPLVQGAFRSEPIRISESMMSDHVTAVGGNTEPGFAEGSQAYFFPLGGGQFSRSIRIQAFSPTSIRDYNVPDSCLNGAQTCAHPCLARQVCSSHHTWDVAPIPAGDPGSRAFYVHSACMPMIQQSISCPACHIHSRLLDVPLLPRGSVVPPRHIRSLRSD